MKKVFVTGATGLLGAHLCFNLLKKGYHVMALKRSEHLSEQFLAIQQYYSNIDGNKIEWVKGDVQDFCMYDYCKDVYFVFHAAALVSFNKSDRKYAPPAPTFKTLKLLSPPNEASSKIFAFTTSYFISFNLPNP